MYYAIGASVSSLHRESTDSLILEECLTLLASGSDPSCLLGAIQMPSDHVKETLCHFRWSSSAAR